MYKIILVEDEAIIRRGIKRGVKWEEQGFEIAAEAEDAEEALRLLQEMPVDVVLTDVKMPGMNGVELSRKVKEQYPQTEIVILSGFAEFEYAKAAVSFGAFEYMVKPVRKQEIEAVFYRLKEKLDRRFREQAEEQRRMLVLNEGMEKLREALLLELLEGERKAYTNLEEEIMRLELELSTRNVQAAVIRIAHPQDADADEVRQTYRKILEECIPQGIFCASRYTGDHPHFFRSGGAKGSRVGQRSGEDSKEDKRGMLQRGQSPGACGNRNGISLHHPPA